MNEFLTFEDEEDFFANLYGSELIDLSDDAQEDEESPYDALQRDAEHHMHQERQKARQNREARRSW